MCWPEEGQHRSKLEPRKGLKVSVKVKKKVKKKVKEKRAFGSASENPGSLRQESFCTDCLEEERFWLWLAYF